MGPLQGVTVVEIEGIGPGPFCGMMLADMGADVILVQRKTSNPNAAAAADSATMGKHAIHHRGKRSMAVDLKSTEGVAAVLAVIEQADALIEGFRPSVMERLGLGPDVCLERNPRLVYGRMTGWGQTGPLAHAAGHDINYLGLSGALYYSGHDGEAPFSPTTLVGDVGGGGLMLAFGICAAVVHTMRSGQGQVIDAAITDGSAVMTALLQGMYLTGVLGDDRSKSFFAGAAHWYDSFQCADGKFITLGALEPKFQKEFIEAFDLADAADAQFDSARWPELKARVAAKVKQRTRDEWCELLEGTDICFAPVLNFTEAARHPHNRARETFVEIEGIMQPAPAPRFSETAPAVRNLAPEIGAHTRDVLRHAGLSAQEIERLFSDGVI